MRHYQSRALLVLFIWALYSYSSLALEFLPAPQAYAQKITLKMIAALPNVSAETLKEKIVAGISHGYMCDQLQPFLAINETFRSELASMLKLVQHDKQAQENGIAPTTTTTAIDEELYYLNWLALVVGELDDIHNLNALYIITTFVKQSYPEVAKYYESPTPETLTRLLQRFQSKSLPDINEHIKWLYSPAYLSERLLRNTGDNHNRLHRIDSDLIYVDFFPRTLSYFSDSRIEHVCKKYDQMRLYRPALDAGHE